MGILSLCILGIGLAMDAFAVSVCDGLCYRDLRKRDSISIALCFGIFQGMMPTVGFLLGTRFSSYITAFDHWIALVLLGALGGRMVFEALRGGDDLPGEEMLTGHTLLLQGIATSIDALAVGISLAALGTQILSAAMVIGIITLVISLVGVWIGKRFGVRLNRAAKILGGMILILIGVKIFLEHII